MGHDSTNTVPDPSQDNTVVGKQEESKAPVETPKTVAHLLRTSSKNSTHLVSQLFLQVLPKKHGTFLTKNGYSAKIKTLKRRL